MGGDLEDEQDSPGGYHHELGPGCLAIDTCSLAELWVLDRSHGRQEMCCRLGDVPGLAHIEHREGLPALAVVEMASFDNRDRRKGRRPR